MKQQPRSLPAETQAALERAVLRALARTRGGKWSLQPTEQKAAA